MSPAARKQVAVWLFACCLLLFVLIVVGGATRLTRSGLSIVEWQPIAGVVPPLNAAQWREAFEKYQGSPEYRQVNRGMSLTAFKRIYWWEYTHRLLGRLLALAFLCPLAVFAARRRIDLRLGLKLSGIFVLGALQGVLGWYMVKSGLVDDPRVSHLRLTAHLGLAFLILAAMLWVALDLVQPAAGSAGARASGRLASIVVGLAFAMILTGGLVAGIRAGYAYNTFPLMNGRWIPPEILSIEPWYLNFVANMATVQFDHRVVALLLAVCVAALWLKCRRRAPRVRLASTLLLCAAALQIGLGVATLLLRVPIGLGVAHQAGAVLVFAAALWTAHSLRARPG